MIKVKQKNELKFSLTNFFRDEKILSNGVKKKNLNIGEIALVKYLIISLRSLHNNFRLSKMNMSDSFTATSLLVTIVSNGIM